MSDVLRLAIRLQIQSLSTTLRAEIATERETYVDDVRTLKNAVEEKLQELMNYGTANRLVGLR
jgi:hypothetical protein